MDEHISYAMRNTEALNRWLSFNAPNELKDWSFLAIEFILVVGAICTVLHASRHYKENGNFSALLTVLGAFTWGLLNDIASYYTVESFWHGEFSVMLVYNRLPLYITLLYPALVYHAYMTIRRYGFSRVVEALGIGFFTGLMYMIFDNVGPMLNWWIWDRSDPTNWPFLNAVPITSYFWIFSWTAAFSFISRIICWDWVEQRKSPRQIGIGIALVPVLTVVTGIVLFLPMNLLSYNGLYPQVAALYAVAFGLGGLTFVLLFRRPRAPRDRLLMVFPLVWVVGHLIIYIAKLDIYFSVQPDGLSADGLAVGNLVVALAAMIGSSTITLISHPTDPDRAANGGDS